MSGPNRSTAGLILLGAAILGGAVGVLPGMGNSAEPAPSLADFPSDAVEVATAVIDGRARPPQPGDDWGGCNDARAAGTAPIYAGEPGYREDMDGDADGVACETYY